MDSDDADEEIVLTTEDKEIAWDVNALLMALHEGSEDLYNCVLRESSNPAALLGFANATLKMMVDSLIEILKEFGMSVSFSDLVHMHAEFLAEVKTQD